MINTINVWAEESVTPQKSTGKARMLTSKMNVFEATFYKCFIQVLVSFENIYDGVEMQEPMVKVQAVSLLLFAKP